jgi:hypothetical protein
MKIDEDPVIVDRFTREYTKFLRTQQAMKQRPSASLSHIHQMVQARVKPWVFWIVVMNMTEFR